jgi:hypothetical protein
MDNPVVLYDEVSSVPVVARARPAPWRSPDSSP